MYRGLWGKKIGMTQVFAGDKVVPVTVIDVDNWFITSIKTIENDGYSAVQVGRVKDKFVGSAFSPEWLKKPKQFFSALREIRLDEQSLDGLEVGRLMAADSIIAPGETVSAFGITKGCGFAGVVRRHRFRGPPASHGSMMGNRPGSIGNFSTQGKVIKGKKLPGQMGNRNRMVAGLEVVRVESDARVVLLKGSIPGKAGSLVFIRKSIG